MTGVQTCALPISERDAAARFGFHAEALILNDRINDLKSGGSLVVERAPRAVKETLDVWGPVAPEVLDVMRRLKHEFDPAGILNPGRFAGGL